MIINFKDGVTPDKLKDVTFRAIFICAEVFNKYNYPLTITSTHEGTHLPDSFHYIGQAIDIRTRRIPKAYLPKLCKNILEKLHQISECYQLVLEENHIHIEYDNR